MTATIVLLSYLAVLAGMLILALVSRRWPNRVTPLGAMLHHVMRSRTVRLGIIAAWWWLGWHFLVSDTVQLQLPWGITPGALN